VIGDQSSNPQMICRWRDRQNYSPFTDHHLRWSRL